MSRNMHALLTVAAELRAVGYPWEAVARRVHRRPKTCQGWPGRYRRDWETIYQEVRQRRFEGRTCLPGRSTNGRTRRVRRAGRSIPRPRSRS